MNSSISLKKAGLNFVVYNVTHCAGCISANTRLQPYSVCKATNLCLLVTKKGNDSYLPAITSMLLLVTQQSL